MIKLTPRVVVIFLAKYSLILMIDPSNLCPFSPQQHTPSISSIVVDAIACRLVLHHHPKKEKHT
jgi:hypothetical protein